MTPEHVEWVKAQFDMLLLTFLVCFGVFCLFRAYHYNLEPSAIEWIKTLTTGFSGALLLRINARAGIQRRSDSNGKPNGGKP